MTTLIIPGRDGSGPGHWQSWFENQLRDAVRVRGINWSVPAIRPWAGAIVREIDRASGPVWLVAHSFGVLAALVAAAKRPGRIGGALLAAPADPELFSESGLRDWSGSREQAEPSIARLLPQSPLPFDALLVLSADDPWMRLTTGLTWAQRWGSLPILPGRVGHLNEDSGFGPWPQGLEMFRRFRDAHGGLPIGSLDAEPLQPRARRCNIPSSGAANELRSGTQG